MNGEGMIENKAQRAADMAVTVNPLGSPTYRTLHDWLNTTQSAGLLTGFAVTDGGSGTVDVASGTGFIKTTDSAVGTNVFFDYAGTTGLALTDATTNWVYLDYNSGTPVAAAATDWTTLDLHTQIIIAKVWRDGSSISIVETCQCLFDMSRVMMQSQYEIHGFNRVSGLVLSATNRYVEMTAGAAWEALTRHTFAAKDTDPGGGADTFTSWYVTAGTWTDTAAQTQIDNTQYNDIAAGLATLTANRYGVHWVYIDHDDGLHVQYGQGDYILAAADLAQPPVPPPYLADFAILIGKIVIQKNAAAVYEVESAFASIFLGSAASDHGALGGLADDDHTQYLLATGARAGASSQAQDFGTNGIKADKISESTGAAGIDLDDKALKNLKSLVFNDGGATVGIIRDEDDMASDDANALATQQSIKAYVDAAGGSGLYSAYIKVSDVKAANTAGGTFTTGAWRTRDINTEDSDTGGHCSISSNQITLDAGTYRCLIRAPGRRVGTHKTKLQNITDAAVELIGTSERTDTSTSPSIHSFIAGRFTIAAQKTFEVQHQCSQTQTTNGFGWPSNYGISEVYTVAEFWKES